MFLGVAEDEFNMAIFVGIEEMNPLQYSCLGDIQVLSSIPKRAFPKTIKAPRKPCIRNLTHRGIVPSIAIHIGGGQVFILLWMNRVNSPLGVFAIKREQILIPDSEYRSPRGSFQLIQRSHCDQRQACRPGGPQI